MLIIEQISATNSTKKQTVDEKSIRVVELLKTNV